MDGQVSFARNAALEPYHIILTKINTVEMKKRKSIARKNIQNPLDGITILISSFGAGILKNGEGEVK